MPRLAPPIADEDVAELAAAWHAAYEWQYGECDHATYTGGPSHGAPYEMCVIQAKRILGSEGFAAVVARRLAAANPPMKAGPCDSCGRELLDNVPVVVTIHAEVVAGKIQAVDEPHVAHDDCGDDDG